MTPVCGKLTKKKKKAKPTSNQYSWVLVFGLLKYVLAPAGITLTSTQKWGFLDFILVVGDGSIDDDGFLAEETTQNADFKKVEAKKFT